MVEHIVLAAIMQTTDIQVFHPDFIHSFSQGCSNPLHRHDSHTVFFFFWGPRSRQKLLVDQELRSLLDLQQRQLHRGTCVDVGPVGYGLADMVSMARKTEKIHCC